MKLFVITIHPACMHLFWYCTAEMIFLWFYCEYIRTFVCVVILWGMFMRMHDCVNVCVACGCMCVCVCMCVCLHVRETFLCVCMCECVSMHASACVYMCVHVLVICMNLTMVHAYTFIMCDTMIDVWLPMQPFNDGLCVFIIIIPL